MRKTEFIKAMKEEAAKMGKVSMTTIEKPDRSYKGLMLKARSGVPNPIVNLDALYDDYKAGKMNVDECRETVTAILNMKPETPINPEEFTDWDKARTKLYLRTFGNIANKGEAVYEQKADIYLVPYLQVSDDGSRTARVNQGLIDLWGVSAEDVINEAKANQETLRPAKIYNIGEKLGIQDDLPAYILTTTNEAFGASAIFYTGMEDKLKEKIGEDFYVLPSSIHEVIAVAKSVSRDINSLVKTVTTVNATQVDESDRLTNSVYAFENGIFTQVG